MMNAVKTDAKNTKKATSHPNFLFFKYANRIKGVIKNN
jgi:hypothetical protein